MVSSPLVCFLVCFLTAAFISETVSACDSESLHSNLDKCSSFLTDLYSEWLLNNGRLSDNGGCPDFCREYFEEAERCGGIDNDTKDMLSKALGDCDKGDLTRTTIPVIGKSARSSYLLALVLALVLAVML